jgi:hypothetical protein
MSPVCNRRIQLPISKQINFKVLTYMFFPILSKNNVETNSVHLALMAYTSHGEYSTLIPFRVPGEEGEFLRKN